jgi:4-diphosphocytidyl-2-C-methyl-D-erythritol kinase
LESIFVALAFGDTLWVDRTEVAGACTILMDWKFLQVAGIIPEEGVLPLEKNSIYQAISLFRVQTGFTGGIRVRVEKRIPLGAGLGGGSSDAASTLRALQSLVAPKLPQDQLLEMALALGSDVPFFLWGGAALVSGRGERVVPINVPDGLWVVLVYPGFSSNTAEAFRLLDLARLEPGLGNDAGVTELIGALEKAPSSWSYKNDFLRLFLDVGDQEQARIYRRIVQDLQGLGADFVGLSGAGSVCFGVFDDGGVAKRAGSVLLERQGELNQRYFVQVTFLLAYLAYGVVQ